MGMRLPGVQLSCDFNDELRYIKGVLIISDRGGKVEIGLFPAQQGQGAVRMDQWSSQVSDKMGIRLPGVQLSCYLVTNVILIKS